MSDRDVSIQALAIADRLIAESEAHVRTAHLVFTNQTLFEAVCGELAKRTETHETWRSDCDMSARFESDKWLVEVDYQHTTEDTE